MSDQPGIAVLRDRVKAELQRGYHEQGHHPNCRTKKDAGCDCYARQSFPARAALAQIAAIAESRAIQLPVVIPDHRGGPDYISKPDPFATAGAAYRADLAKEARVKAAEAERDSLRKAVEIPRQYDVLLSEWKDRADIAEARVTELEEALETIWRMHDIPIGGGSYSASMREVARAALAKEDTDE